MYIFEWAGGFCGVGPGVPSPRPRGGPEPQKPPARSNIYTCIVYHACAGPFWRMRQSILANAPVHLIECACLFWRMSRGIRVFRYSGIQVFGYSGIQVFRYSGIRRDSSKNSYLGKRFKRSGIRGGGAVFFTVSRHYYSPCEMFWCNAGLGRGKQTII